MPAALAVRPAVPPELECLTCGQRMAWALDLSVFEPRHDTIVYRCQTGHERLEFPYDRQTGEIKGPVKPGGKP